ncbi:glycoside hydrolase family 3 N-terminal domain-containing protein [Streptomyces hygroscopicus]|nr:glycoside hydrolase family 3 N-terminal domain-containing protein [Streptomyces hygroscopicus]
MPGHATPLLRGEEPPFALRAHEALDAKRRIAAEVSSKPSDEATARGAPHREPSKDLPDMTTTITRDAHTVLLPAVDGFTLPGSLASLLASGTRSVIIGESRAEYVARAMTEERQTTETPQQFTDFTTRLRAIAGASVLVAVDQEPWGTKRLHRLVPGLPDFGPDTDPADVERSAHELGRAALRLGVNTFLSPVCDRLTGDNPWLRGRTLDLPPARIGELAAAFVTGVQRAGVTAVTKHFPGFPEVTADPALDVAHVPEGCWTESDLIPFAACVRAGTRAVMMGPAPVAGLDGDEAALASPATVALLRDLGFDGLIVSDDLDAPATLRGRTAPRTAVAAIRAGVHLLLAPEDGHLGDVAAALIETAEGDTAFAHTLHGAAERVRALAGRRRSAR